MRRRLQEIIQKFREKGATSPEKALTIQELGLPPRFEQAMHRRLGQTGIFVEVNGKYYLNEERLKQIQEQRARGGGAGSGGGAYGRQGSPSWHRYVGLFLMLPIGLLVALALYFFLAYTGSAYYPGEFLIVIAIIALVVFAARLLFWSSRRKYWQQQYFGNRAGA
jgi:hypothetical protein